VRARSAEGLSAAAFELESWGLLVHAAYGYVNRLPFSSYGEAAILLAQNLFLLALVYRYARLPAGRVGAVGALLAGAVAVLASGATAGKGGGGAGWGRWAGAWRRLPRRPATWLQPSDRPAPQPPLPSPPLPRSTSPPPQGRVSRAAVGQLHDLNNSILRPPHTPLPHSPPPPKAACRAPRSASCTTSTTSS
jgi:hypothetical protein